MGAFVRYGLLCVDVALYGSQSITNSVRKMEAIEEKRQGNF